MLDFTRRSGSYTCRPTTNAPRFDAVNFYDQRFNSGFTDQQKEDLVNFLKTL
jgi:hypothetical protein